MHWESCFITETFFILNNEYYFEHQNLRKSGCFQKFHVEKKICFAEKNCLKTFEKKSYTQSCPN